MPPNRSAAATRPAQPALPEARIAIRLKPSAGTGSSPSPDDGIRQAFASTLTPPGLRLSIEPLFKSVGPREIAAMIQRAKAFDPTYTPPALDTWRQVILRAGPRAPLEASIVDQLVDGLQRLATVDSVYAMRVGPPPEVRPGDDPRTPRQGYLDPAPCGIDARHAWTFEGGTGAGVGFVDLEQGWHLDHEDLVDARIALISGVNKKYRPHGTAVLGIVLMVDNAIGGVGIAPSCTGRVISQHRDDGGENIADAITDAAAHMQRGDVLLLEAQEYHPVIKSYGWPVEIVTLHFDLIEFVTKQGITVIEAAGNGNFDLDTYVNAAGVRIFDRGSPGFRDSGAVMVGAAEPWEQHPRWGGSNFGSRIDCYGWGNGIDTAWTNDARTKYTPSFPGTSGASAIVAGAAVILQGRARAGSGRPLWPLELRNALLTGGTPSAQPSGDRIGLMPNLRAIIEAGR